VLATAACTSPALRSSVGRDLGIAARLRDEPLRVLAVGERLERVAEQEIGQSVSSTA